MIMLTSTVYDISSGYSHIKPSLGGYQLTELLGHDAPQPSLHDWQVSLLRALPRMEEVCHDRRNSAPGLHLFYCIPTAT